MSKTQSAHAESGIRKYVLVDKPFFSKGTEGAKFLFNRGGETSIPFAIKKFFMAIPMRAEGKRQIEAILKNKDISKMPDAKKLLGEIKKLHFWQGVKTSAVSDILAKASLRGIDVFPNQNNGQSTQTNGNTLSQSLGTILPKLQDDYLSNADNIHVETIKQAQYAKLKLSRDDLDGLDIIITHMKDPTKKCKDKEKEELIHEFAKKIKSDTKIGNKFSERLKEKIIEVYNNYFSELNAENADEKTSGSKEIKSPKLLTPAIQNEQNDTEIKIRSALEKLPAFKNAPEKLEKFMRFLKATSEKSYPKDLGGYSHLLSLFHKEIGTLDSSTQLFCLNVADKMEALLHIAYISAKPVHINKSRVDQRYHELINSLIDQARDSIAIREFLYYVEGGTDLADINESNYWNLVQFIAHKKNEIVKILDDQTQIEHFNKLADKLAEQLRKFEESKGIPVDLLPVSKDKLAKMSRQQVMQEYINEGIAAINNENLKLLQKISHGKIEFLQFAKTINNLSGDPEKLYDALRADLNMYLAMTSTDIPL